MERKKKIGIWIFILVAGIVLTWSPWLDSKELHDRVMRERGTSDGTIGSDGEIICDYQVMRFPLGRWVVSCEGGWYVTFWGMIFPPAMR